MLLPASIKKAKKSGTLSQPSRTDSILSCSKVLHRHILKRDVANAQQHEQGVYDIEHFIPARFNVCVPVIPSAHGLSAFRQRPRLNKLPTPDEKKIYRFCKRLVERAHLNAECVIIALIYIERLMERKAINVNARNWIPVLVAALLTASKVWDDHSTFNGDLPAIVPVFTVQGINELERQFLGDLDYELHIPSSEYARYYFGLRALRKQEVKRIPKFYLKIGITDASRVHEKTLRQEGDHRGMGLSI